MSDNWTEGPLVPREKKSSNRIIWKYYVLLLVLWVAFLVYSASTNENISFSVTLSLVLEGLFYLLCLAGVMGYAFRIALIHNKIWVATFLAFTAMMLWHTGYNIYIYYPELEFFYKGLLPNLVFIGFPIGYCLFGYSFREAELWN